MEALKARISNQSFFEIGNRLSIVYTPLSANHWIQDINVGAALYAVDEYLRTLEFV